MRIVKLTDKTGKPFWIKVEACLALLPADPSRNDKREWSKTQVMIAPGLTVGVRERMALVCAMLEETTIPVMEDDDDASDKQERIEELAGMPEAGVAEVQETERTRGVFRIAEAQS